jgi:hypothetical protein
MCILRLQHVTARSHLTVRNVPPGLARALESEKRRRGVSLNQTVIELLARALGLAGGPRPGNGLEKLGGNWSDAEYRQFVAATSQFDRIDEELWR